jgi:hypothetical protein
VLGVLVGSAYVLAFEEFAVELLGELDDCLISHKLVLNDADDMPGAKVFKKLTVGLTSARSQENEVDFFDFFSLIPEQLLEFLVTDEVALSSLSLKNKEVSLVAGLLEFRFKVLSVVHQAMAADMDHTWLFLNHRQESTRCQHRSLKYNCFSGLSCFLLDAFGFFLEPKLAKLRMPSLHAAKW